MLKRSFIDNDVYCKEYKGELNKNENEKKNENSKPNENKHKT